MNFFKRLFINKKKLIQELEKTKVELAECGDKLVEKQEHINQTNSYWKKKMYAVKAQKNKEE